MENEELLQKAKETKSAEELMAIAKQNGMELSEEEAQAYFAQLHKSGELSDEELGAVAGGGCHSKDGRLVVTIAYSCSEYICKDCGKHFEPGGTHQHSRYEENVGKVYTVYSNICNTCKYMSHEKGLWLCNHPANRH